PASSAVSELKKVVPDTYAVSTGVTICNTTNPASRVRPAAADALSLSQNVTEPPLMKVTTGNYALWANNERWQCLWNQEMTSTMKSDGKGANGNNSSISGLDSASGSPSNTAYANHNFNVRVRACAPDYIAGASTLAN